jgi:GntR family transcriptional regulator
MRIADDLRRAIYSGALAPGQPIPTYAELSAQHGGAATATVANAVKQLIREGLIVSKPGTRSYVRERPAVTRMVRTWYQRPGGGSPWRAEMAAAGRDGSWNSTTELVDAPAAIAERLQLDAGARLVRTRYLFLLDGSPTYLSTSWEPLELTGDTDIMLPESGPYAGAGVRDRMAAIGHAPTRAEEALRPHTLTDDEAKALGLYAGVPCIAVERTYYEGDRPLETADIVLPPHYRAVYDIPVS